MIKKSFGIIGKPLSHSLSPTIHNFWFKKYNIAATYSLIEIKLDKIREVIEKIRNNELHGINVTVPYKQAVIPFLDLIINDAKITNSVNTIGINRDGKIYGDNTDVYGLERGFLNKLDNQNLEKNKILIIGAGGVAPSIIYALVKRGFKKIFISNRTHEKGENLKKKFTSIEVIEWEDVEKESEDMDIIINATSLGLKGGNDFKQEFQKTKTNLVYYDVIYNPEETEMLKRFKKKGAKTLNGLEMFIYQGQKSFKNWHGINPELDTELKQAIITKLK